MGIVQIPILHSILRRNSETKVENKSEFERTKFTSRFLSSAAHACLLFVS